MTIVKIWSHTSATNFETTGSLQNKIYIRHLYLFIKKELFEISNKTTRQGNFVQVIKNVISNLYKDEQEVTPAVYTQWEI